MAGIEQTDSISEMAYQLNSGDKEVKINAIAKLARIASTTDILINAFRNERDESIKEVLFKHILSRVSKGDRETISEAFKKTEILKNPKFFKLLTEQIIIGPSDIAWATLDIVRRINDPSLLSSLNNQNIINSIPRWRKKYLMDSDNFKGSLADSELAFQIFSLCEYLSEIPESDAIGDLRALGMREDPGSNMGILIRRIGKDLNNRGHMELMQTVACNVQSLGGNVDRLNNYWNGVGDWRY